MQDKINAILDEVNKVIIGKSAAAETLFTAILAKGHVLIDDVPGVGKTTLAIAISRALGLGFRRIQFTPDVLPSDIIGFSVYDRESESLRYMPGVVTDANILLGDEINRTSSKTQSALLEAMEEEQVTVDGQTHPLKKPFIVIATQNNVGSVGTQLLPYAQLDRFLVKMRIGYPDYASQMELIHDRKTVNPLDNIRQIADEAELLEMQQEAQQVALKDEVIAYIASLAMATRDHPMCEMGVSPRGALQVSRMARARAYLKGRDYTTPEDVRRILPDVCAHRILLRREGGAKPITPEQVIDDVIGKTQAPDSMK